MTTDRTGLLSARALTIRGVVALVAVGCACSTNVPLDTGLFDVGLDATSETPDTGDLVDTGVDARSIDTGSGMCTPDRTQYYPVCDPTSDRDCQAWAEGSLPGWDVTSVCSYHSNPIPGGPAAECYRGDACHSVDAGSLFDAGGGPSPVECTCGDGPPCEPGYHCARPIGDPTLPRTCVCATPS
jgi:hypothetical protein